MKRSRILILSSLVVIIAAVIVVLVTKPWSNAQAVASAIPVGSTMAVAKAHSQGTLPACLSDNKSAHDAVNKDDTLISGKWSTFELESSAGIIDVPAGTNFDVNVHSFNGKTAAGTVSYPAKYGDYNYTMTRISDQAHWRMTSLIACKKA